MIVIASKITFRIRIKPDVTVCFLILILTTTPRKGSKKLSTGRELAISSYTGFSAPSCAHPPSPSGNPATLFHHRLGAMDQQTAQIPVAAFGYEPESSATCA